MPASLNDNFMLVAGEGSVTSMGAPGKAEGASSFSIDDATGWNTTTGFVVAIRVVDDQGNEVDGTYTEWAATLSGTTVSLGTSPTPLVGNDQDYAASVNTQVYVPVSATRENRMVTALLQQHNQNGSHHGLTSDTLTTTGDVAVGGGLTVSGALSLSNNSVLRAALEKPHYNCLFFAQNGGTVFGAGEVTTPYDASDTTNGYGITATTGTNAYMTIARDGFYEVTANFRCCDVAANDFIIWFGFNDVNNSDSFLTRRQDQAIGVGQGDSWSVCLFLHAGTQVYQQMYNSGGATRFGRSNDSGSAPQLERIAAQSLTVMEIR